MKISPFIIVAVQFVSALSGSAMAAELFPVIKNYGGIHPAPDATERPDGSLRYRVVFNITRASASPDDLNPSREKVARFINLIGQDRLRANSSEIVAIIHGAATPIILNNEAYGKKHAGRDNPNLELVRRLREAGASVRVCSQALAGQHIPQDDVDKLVDVDVAALITLANLQLRGFALAPD